MELIVIRHGETQANAEGRYQGALDIGLNQDGARHICWLADEIATTLARSIGCWRRPCCEQERAPRSSHASWGCLWSLLRPFVSGMSVCLRD